MALILKMDRCMTFVFFVIIRKGNPHIVSPSFFFAKILIEYERLQLSCCEKLLVNNSHYMHNLFNLNEYTISLYKKIIRNRINYNPISPPFAQI